MGVLNVTPDSFSDGGQLPTTEAVVARAREMIAAGADVLDVGGESTRPGAVRVSVADELARVLPAIAAVRQACPNVPISIDTYKAEVAAAAVAAGADIINDVWGLAFGFSAEERSDWRNAAHRPAGVVAGVAAPGSSSAGSPSPADTAAGPLRASPMAEVAARTKVPVILMHNRLDRAYGDFWTDVLQDLEMSLALARAAGIPAHQIWLDPGFGFAKTPAHNLEVLRELHRLVALGFPVLVGTSRKSTLGLVLGTGVDDRLDASGATVVWAIQQGCAMVRVHDVRGIVRFVRMADAIRAGLNFSPPDHG